MMKDNLKTNILSVYQEIVGHDATPMNCRKPRLSCILNLSYNESDSL